MDELTSIDQPAERTEPPVRAAGPADRRPGIALRSHEAPSVAPVWLRPEVLMLVFALLQLWWMDHGNWNWPHVMAILVSVVFFWLSGHRATPPAAGPTTGETALMWRTVRLVARLMLLGYVLWLLSAVQRGLSPADLVDFVSLQPDASERLKRDLFVSSIVFTFFVNLTVVYFGLAGTLAFKSAGRLSSRRQRVAGLRNIPAFWVLATITILRAVLLSERLVMLEMMLALIGAYFVGVPRSLRSDASSVKRRKLRRRLPLLLIIGALFFFGVAEIPRSFAGKQADGLAQGPVEYAADRLVSYYGSAGDNGAIALNHVEPIWNDGLYLSTPAAAAILGQEEQFGDRWFAILDQYGSREFNNSGGWTALLVDFGVPLGLLFVALTFFMMGHWWAISMRRPAVAAIVVPVVLVTAFDLARILYLGQTRAIVALFIAAVLQERTARIRDGGRVSPVGAR